MHTVYSVGSLTALRPAFSVNAIQNGEQPSLKWEASMDSFTTFDTVHASVNAHCQPPIHGSDVKHTRVSIVVHGLDLLYHSVSEGDVSITHPEYDGDIQSWFDSLIRQEELDRYGADRVLLSNTVRWVDNDFSENDIPDSAIPSKLQHISPFHEEFADTVLSYITDDLGKTVERSAFSLVNTVPQVGHYVLLVNRSP